MHSNVTPATPLLLFILILATALGPLAMSSFLPALPEIQSTFATSTSVAQLTMSVSMISMAVFALIYGTMADRYGRRPVLLTGIGVAVLGSLACGFAQSIEWAIAGRALQAAGSTSGMILTRVIVYDVYGDKRTASILGYIVASMTIAPLVGPILGGVLIEEYSWRWVFFGIALMALLLWLLILMTLPETRRYAPSERGPMIPLDEYGHLLRRPDLRNFLMFFALSQSVFMAFLAGVPYLIASHYQLPATLYGFFVAPVAVGYAFGGLLAGKYADRVSHHTLVAACAWASTIAVLTGFVLVLGGWESPWAVCLPATLVAIAISFATPAAQTEILSAAGRHAGSASGFSSFFQLVFSAFVAQMVGWTADFGPLGVLGPMLLCALGAALLISLTGRAVSQKPAPGS